MRTQLRQGSVRGCLVIAFAHGTIEQIRNLGVDATARAMTTPRERHNSRSRDQSLDCGIEM
jgi:hypothetical protein